MLMLMLVSVSSSLLRPVHVKREGFQIVSYSPFIISEKENERGNLGTQSPKTVHPKKNLQRQIRPNKGQINSNMNCNRKGDSGAAVMVLSLYVDDEESSLRMRTIVNVVFHDDDIGDGAVWRWWQQWRQAADRQGPHLTWKGGLGNHTSCSWRYGYDGLRAAATVLGLDDDNDMVENT